MKRYLGLLVGALTVIALALVAGCAPKPSPEEGPAPGASTPAPTEKSAGAGTAMPGEEKAGEAGAVQEEAHEHEHEHEAVPAEYASLTNPLPDEEATRAAGKKLYQTKCLGCHGASGGGDGPQAAGMKPPPADFTDASMMEDMTDAALFWRISEGSQGTAMPAWKDQLKEDERWQLVRYLRTFSQAPPAASSGVEKSHPHHDEGEEHHSEGHGDH